MHTYQDLLERKNKDGNVLFFLYLLKQAILEFRDPFTEDYDDENYKKIADIVIFYKITEHLCRLDSHKFLKEIFKSPFDTSIIDCNEFFIFFFSFLSKIMILVDEPRSRRNVKNVGFSPPRRPGENHFDPQKFTDQMSRGLLIPTEIGLDIPVSYDYFKKIVVASQVGEWKYMEFSGNIVIFKPPLIIDVLSKEEQLTPIVRYVNSAYEIANIAKILNRPELTRFHGFCVYEDPPGNLWLLDDIPSPHTPESLHKLIVAKKIDDISKQKEKYSILANNMKNQGYPYQNTYDEYIRFLKTNLKNMNFNGYTLKVKLIFDMFIPSSLA